MLGNRGDISLSIPASSSLILRDEFLSFLVRNDLASLSFDVDTRHDPASDGSLPPERSRVFMPNDRMYRHLRQYCKTIGTHGTSLENVRRNMLSSRYGFHTHAPAMACMTSDRQLPSKYSFRDFVMDKHNRHRTKDVPSHGFACEGSTSPFVQCLDVDATSRASLDSLAQAAKSEGLTYAAVTKLLERSEMYSNPKAVDAVRAEGQALVEAGTWNESTVIEKSELIAKAKSNHEQIHLCELMSIASIKFYELPPD